MHHFSTLIAGSALLLGISAGCNTAGPPMPAGHPTAQPSSQHSIQQYGQPQYGEAQSGASQYSGEAQYDESQFGESSQYGDSRQAEPVDSQAPGMSPEQSIPTPADGR